MCGGGGGGVRWSGGSPYFFKFVSVQLSLCLLSGLLCVSTKRFQLIGSVSLLGYRLQQ